MTTEATDGSPGAARSETERRSGLRAWQAPKLTTLGELDSHTGAGGSDVSDGDHGSEFINVAS